MPPASSADGPTRLLLVMPSWLGDTVMATPTLRALRARFPAARITALVRPALTAILDAAPWVDQVIEPAGGVLATAARLRARRFDAAVLLPNSFRAALIARLAGIPRRIGYARDGRGWMLTDRLAPRRCGRRFVPVATRDYYLDLARHLGAADPDPAMQLFTRPEDDARAAELLAASGAGAVHRRDACATASGGARPLVVLNPGANYGDAKMWPAARFAAVGDRCVDELGCAVAVSGAPGERAILDQVLAAARRPMIDLPARGVDLRLLKSIVRRAALLITNDTGPRHVAAAFGVPVVTIFGPTDPVWSEIHYDRERQVRVEVPCGPCQLKRCPLDRRCMTEVTVEMVLARAAELLRGPAGHPVPPVAGPAVEPVPMAAPVEHRPA